MKKGFILTILIMMLICAISGCDKKKLEDFADIQQTALEHADIHIYTKGYGTGGQPRDKTLIENMLDEIGNRLSDTLKVTPRFYWIPYEQFENEIAKLIQSKDKIDAFTDYTPIPYVQQDLLLDLSVLFPEKAPKYFNELTSNKVGADYLYQCSVKDKLYMIPYNNIENPRHCIVIRKELAEKYAPAGIETLEEYGRFLEKIKENEKSFFPGYISAHNAFQAYMEGNGYYTEYATYFYSRWDEPTNHYSMEQTPEFLQAYLLLKEWNEKGYMIGNTKSGVTFQNNKLASQLIRFEDIPDLFGSLTRTDTQFKVLPLYMNSMHLIPTSGKGLAISKNCAIPERVVSFIEWLHEAQENYDLFMYGIKDKNYALQNERILFPSTVRPLETWYNIGSDYFKDFRYERITPNMEEGFKELYQEACFKNTKTTRELMQATMDKMEKEPEKIEDLTREFQQVSVLIETYFDNMRKFLDSIDSGSFQITPDELKDMQKEAGVEQILSVYRKSKQLTAE